jgi:DNA-binding MurR/RpiR family transcriptional regulator
MKEGGLVGFRATVQSQSTKLTPAEQRVVALLLDDPGQSVLAPAAQIAGVVGVHEATVTRLAQKLGYTGYAALRADLKKDAQQLAGSAARTRARAAKGHELNRLVGDEIQALGKLPEYVDQESLDAAARTLLGARRVYVFGAHHATTLVEFMDRRLRRIGMEVMPLRSQGRELAEHAVNLSSEDAVLAFAFKKQPPGLGELLSHAHTVGCPTILVTDPPGVLIRPIPGQLLVAPRGADEDFHTLIVPLVICYGLQLALTNLDTDRFGAALDQVESLTRIYAVDNSDRDFETYTRD